MIASEHAAHPAQTKNERESSTQQPSTSNSLTEDQQEQKGRSDLFSVVCDCSLLVHTALSLTMTSSNKKASNYYNGTSEEAADTPLTLKRLEPVCDFSFSCLVWLELLDSRIL